MNFSLISSKMSSIILSFHPPSRRFNTIKWSCQCPVHLQFCFRDHHRRFHNSKFITKVLLLFRLSSIQGFFSFVGEKPPCADRFNPIKTSEGKVTTPWVPIENHTLNHNGISWWHRTIFHFFSPSESVSFARPSSLLCLPVLLASQLCPNTASYCHPSS